MEHSLTYLPIYLAGRYVEDAYARDLGWVQEARVETSAEDHHHGLAEQGLQDHATGMERYRAGKSL
jgi:hypothetical protein